MAALRRYAVAMNPSSPALARPAHLGWRLFAMVYDFFPALALWVALSGIFLLPRAGVPVAPGSIGSWFELLCLWLITGAYAVLSWQRGGQTLGMRPWRLKVTAADGSRATNATGMPRSRRYCSPRSPNNQIAPAASTFAPRVSISASVARTEEPALIAPSSTMKRESQPPPAPVATHAVDSEEMIAEPGAEMSGFMTLSRRGPEDENVPIAFSVWFHVHVPGGLIEFQMMASRETAGNASLSRSSRFAPSSDDSDVRPVPVPPGRARLSTSPLATGSLTATNTIGVSRVAW